MRKNMRKKNGFTLIELLAVIVILAIIALITVPLILNVIEEASMGSFKSTAYGIVRSAETECVTNLIYGNSTSREVFFENYQMGTETIKFRGKSPKSGNVYINQKCEVAIAIHDGKKWCAQKEITSDEVIISEASESECQLNLEKGLTEEQLKCLVNNQCDGVTLPEDYAGTEGKWLPIASRQDLDNIMQEGPANNMVFASATVFEKIWNDDSYTADNGRYEQRYIVVNDFDMGTSEFTPFGFQSRPFCGVFDGNYKEIANLTTTTKGLIDRLEPTGGSFTTCYIQNIGLTNVNVTSSDSYVGGIAGGMRSSYIKNSYVDGNITGIDYVGGLVGQVQSGVVTSTYAKGKVTGNEYIGGLVGYYSEVSEDENLDIIENVYAKIDVEGHASVGGLLGESNVTVIRNVHAEGNVIGISDVGGLIGRFSQSNLLENAYTKSTVEGEENVGGLVGSLDINELKNSYFNVSVTGDEKVGGICGVTYTDTIDNVYAKGNIIGTYQVGGVIGRLDNNELKNSYFEGNVTGELEVGGLVGASYTYAINNVYAKGNITGVNKVGGLLGLAYDDATDNAYTEGTVTGVTRVGGLMGESHSTSISNSYSKSNISGINDSDDVAGFVGLIFYAEITNCYANGNVQGKNNVGGFANGNFEGTQLYSTGTVTGIDNIGGLVGRSYGGSVITKSYALGNVSGQNNVGGFVGSGAGDQISNSYVINEVIGNNYVGGLIGNNSGVHLDYVYAANKKLTGQSSVGGLIGGPEYSGPPITYSYWDTTISSVLVTAPIEDSVGIEGKTTAQMKNQSTYVNWDFTDTWTIHTNEYPKLKWQN